MDIERHKWGKFCVLLSSYCHCLSFSIYQQIKAFNFKFVKLFDSPEFTDSKIQIANFPDCSKISFFNIPIEIKHFTLLFSSESTLMYIMQYVIHYKIHYIVFFKTIWTNQSNDTVLRFVQVFLKQTLQHIGYKNKLLSVSNRFTNVVSSFTTTPNHPLGTKKCCLYVIKTNFYQSI